MPKKVRKPSKYISPEPEPAVFSAELARSAEKFRSAVMSLPTITSLTLEHLNANPVWDDLMQELRSNLFHSVRAEQDYRLLCGTQFPDVLDNKKFWGAQYSGGKKDGSHDGH